jgi:hypothetical protein
MMTAAQKWRKLLAWLRRNFPADYAVTVRTTPLKKHHGYTEYNGKFQVKINRKQCLALRVETLIHEWAHVLTWFGAETHLDDHNSEWGLAYARIYRTFLEWNYGKGVRDEPSTD